MVLHVACRALGSDDDAEEVHVHDAREVVEVVRQEPLERAADPGVVEHDVQSAEPIDGEVDERLNLVGVAHIRPLKGRCLTEFRGEFLAAIRIDVGDHDARTFGDEQLGRRPADAAGTPGDDRHLPRELLCVHGATIEDARHAQTGRSGGSRC